MKRKFAAVLFKNRFQSQGSIRHTLERKAAPAERRQRVPKRQHIRGIHKGQFFRIKIPPSSGSSSPPLYRLPKLRNHANPTLKPFVKVDEKYGYHHHAGEDFWQRARTWLQYNYGVRIFNFGSIFSLLAYTQSDVLDLRILSAVGSLSSIVYLATIPAEQRSFTPLLWSLSFLTANGVKIRDILQERRGATHFPNKEQERIYHRYFCQHGVTPFEFAAIMKRARIIRLNRGDVLLRQGAPLKRVFLVTQGQTSAQRGHDRRLLMTNDQYHQEAVVQQQGGSAGAWLGDMAFVEHYWNKGKLKTLGTRKPVGAEYEIFNNGTTTNIRPFWRRRLVRYEPQRAMYSVSAVQDGTIVLAWKHADMEALMKKSSALETTLIRAMTTAIVAKIVAFEATKKAAAALSSSTSKRSSWWQGWRSPPPHDTGETLAPVIPWVEEEYEEEDEPKKVTINRKPSFLLPEAQGD